MIREEQEENESLNGDFEGLEEPGPALKVAYLYNLETLPNLSRNTIL